MKKRKKIFIPLLIFSFLLFFTSSFLIYQKEKVKLIKEIELELFTYSINIKEYFLNAQSIIYSLKYTLEDKMSLGCCIHPAFNQVNYDKDKNLSLISNKEGIKGYRPSIITSIGNYEEYSFQKNIELSSALHLKPIFNASFKIIPDLIWVYYTSKNDFLYISPEYILENDKQFKSIYNLAFWQEAVPRNNPKKSLVITELYIDAAGKGVMTTLSMPVFYKNQFKGIVSIDLGIKGLVSLLPKTDYFGNTYLIDEKNQITASNQKFTLGEKVSVSSKDININIIDNQITLLHKFDVNQLFENSLKNSITEIIITLLVICLALTALYLKVILDKVQYYANTDSLTKLLNRRAMQIEINRMISESKRYNHQLSFLLIDLDFFKKINDKYGHQTGDKVLVEISKLFKREARSSDFIARYGGEEFLIGLSNTKLDDAYILAERIRNAVKKIKIDNYDISLTISIGCTEIKEKDNYFEILKRVDKLLYEAKETGRDKTVKD